MLTSQGSAPEAHSEALGGASDQQDLRSPSLTPCSPMSHATWPARSQGCGGRWGTWRVPPQHTHLPPSHLQLQEQQMRLGRAAHSPSITPSLSLWSSLVSGPDPIAQYYVFYLQTRNQLQVLAHMHWCWEVLKPLVARKGSAKPPPSGGGNSKACWKLTWGRSVSWMGLAI